ncbi:alpha/beta hydrolase [Eubacteriales bacterium OttesenSCG-928-A19]|nr:alpha/beta hydrolase [Eubacteriales bacterium OttesenSCG-928-A19]
MPVNHVGGEAMHLTVRGVSVYYEQHGGGAQDVLLLHGWGCSTKLWQPITDRLSARARVTVIDFPGHGQSGRPPEPWGAEDFARMTAELIETLGIAGCDVIGHSHGGRVALLLAAQHPALLRRLIVTGAAGLRAEPTPEQQRRSARYKRLRAINDMMDRMRVFGPLPSRTREALIQRYGSPDYRALDAEMRQTFVKVVNFDITPHLSSIQAPTLLLWGSADTETPLWMGQRMESLIPDAGLVVLDEGGHYAYLEKSSDFLRITEHFLFGGPT